MSKPIKKADFFAGDDSAYFRREFALDLSFVLKLAKGTPTPDYILKFIRDTRRRHARAAVAAVKSKREADELARAVKRASDVHSLPLGQPRDV